MTLLHRIAVSFSIDGLQDTVRRFPLSVACVLLLFIYGVSLIFEWITPDRFVQWRMILSVLYGFFWCGAVQLFAEARQWAVWKNALTAIGGLLFFFVLSFIGHETDITVRMVSIFMALLVLVFVAPFLTTRQDNLSYWCFSRDVGFGAGVATLAALILSAGATLAIVSVGYLFELKISEEVYGMIWMFGMILLVPVYALSFVPKTFHVVLNECRLTPQVGFIANWILAPLVAVYLAILYAYFVKIGVTMDVPKNQLSYMTMGYAIAAILTYQIAWPFVQAGKARRLLQFLIRYLFPLLIVPVLVMVYAILIRIGEYGITEKRYVVLAAALWFVFLTVGFSLRRLGLKHISLSFVVILLMSCFGPWGMINLSVASQSARLEELLKKNGLLNEKGELNALQDQENISLEDRQSISSIAQYLNEPFHKRGNDKVLYGEKNSYDFLQALNITPVNSYEIERRQILKEENKFEITFTETPKGAGRYIPLGQSGYYFPYLYINHEKSETIEADDQNFVFDLKDNSVSVKTARGIARFDLLFVLKNETGAEKISTLRVEDKKILRQENSSYFVDLHIDRLEGEWLKDGGVQITNFSGSAVYLKR